jgi:hypothetical protein
VDLRSRLGSGRADATDERGGARHHLFGAPRHRSLRVLAAATVALTLTTAACGGDDDETADESSATTATTAPATTAASDEEPPGTDPEAVEPYLDALLRRYDEITSQIVADPEIAADDEHDLYTDLRAVLDPNSEMANAIVQSLVTQGEQGVAIEPFQDAPEPAQRTVDGDVETVSEAEVRFPLCTRYSYRLVTSGRIEVGDNHDRRSQGTAVLVDGHWLISRLEGNNDSVECEEVE